MRNLITICLWLLISMPGYAIPAVVDYVIDGDTFDVVARLADDISADVRVRIINIDTPEMNGKCDLEIEMAYRAKDKLSEILPSGTVIDLKNIQEIKFLKLKLAISKEGLKINRVLYKLILDLIRMKL